MDIDLLVKLFVKIDDFCKITVPIWNNYIKNYNDNSYCISYNDGNTNTVNTANTANNTNIDNNTQY